MWFNVFNKKILIFAVYKPAILQHFRTFEQRAKHGSGQINKSICGSVSKLTKLDSRILDGWFFEHIVLFLWDLHSSEFKQQLSCSKLQMTPRYKKQ